MISLHADAQLVALEGNTNLNRLVYLPFVFFRDRDGLLGDTDSRQVHSSAEPRLGAASPVNVTPGSSNTGASAARMTCMLPPDRQASLFKLACL